MKLVDSHCHLNRLAGFESHQSAEHVVAAKEKGVHHILCVGVNLEEMPDIIALAERYPEVHASVGIHPLDISGHEDWAHYAAYAAHPRVVALGEMGLDFYREENQNPSNQALQKTVFKKQIGLAKTYRKPIIIHTRSAADETLKLLREEKSDNLSGVFHCFTENWSVAEQALDLGFYISISGIVTFKNAKDIQEVATRVPLERLLIETDSPYLAPVPHRGESNVPAHVRFVAQKIADLREMPVEKIAEHTTENYKVLFGVS